MRYINSTKGGLIAFVFFIYLTVFLPNNGPSDEVTLILTVSTFLFAILAGFFISRAGSRYDNIRTAVGTEDALFLSLYHTSRTQGKKFSNKIKQLIDHYYILFYDNDLSDYSYKRTIPVFLQIWDQTVNLKTKKIGYQYILEILDKIESNRNIASTVSKEKLSMGQWIVLDVLTIVILFSLFYQKTDEVYSYIITILLSTVLIIILLILRDLSNLKFGKETSLLDESGEEVLESIGLLRYYNQKFINKGYHKIPNTVEQYRVGHHRNSEKFNIEIVKNPNFNSS